MRQFWTSSIFSVATKFTHLKVWFIYIYNNKTVEHMESNSVWSECQHSFTAKRSCTTNLLAIFRRWTESLNIGTPADAISLTLRRHLILYQTIACSSWIVIILSYRIAIHARIKGFLVCRSQRACVISTNLDWSAVTTDVPRGTVLASVTGPVGTDNNKQFVDYCDPFSEQNKSLFPPNQQCACECKEVGHQMWSIVDQTRSNKQSDKQKQTELQ